MQHSKPITIRLSYKSGALLRQRIFPAMLAIYTSAIHAHHRLALRALSSNASLFLRIKRYNARMAIVRTLKAAGGVV